MPYTIYAIDFDGTICENAWPDIGRMKADTVLFILDLQNRGDKWILLTMREGKKLKEALAWLKKRCLFPDAVNDNLPERCEQWGNNPRKIYADVYIDDHNAGGLRLPDTFDSSPASIPPSTPSTPSTSSTPSTPPSASLEGPSLGFGFGEIW